MKKLTTVVFVVLLALVAYATFLPQPPFPNVTTSYAAEQAASIMNVH